MDIGTAKPSRDEQLKVPHRLIDMLEPHQVYSAGAFCRDAAEAITEICAADRLPVLAGGSMLYFQALQRGLAQLPSADPAVRTEIDARAAQAGWPAMHAELEQLDPVSAARIRPNDSQRIQRAMEVCLLSGERLSALQERTDPVLQVDYLNIGLIPSDRTLLHGRIEARFKAMLDAGLVAEVERIAAAQGVSADSPSLRAVGYRQVLQHLRGELTLDEAIARAVIATRQLAKRQMTWLRSWPDLHVIDSLDGNSSEQVEQLVGNWLSGRRSGPC
jgi:tRNA dimethylallyltransferase